MKFPIDILHIINEYVFAHKLLDWIEKRYLRKDGLSHNPNAIEYLIQNKLIHQCSPSSLSANPGAINFLIKNKRFIRYRYFASNPSPKAIEFIIENIGDAIAEVSEIDLFILLCGNPKFTAEHAGRLNNFNCIFAIDENTDELIFPEIIFHCLKWSNSISINFIKNFIGKYGTEILSADEWNLLAYHCSDTNFINKYYHKFDKIYLHHNKYAFDILIANNNYPTESIELAKNTHPNAIKILTDQIDNDSNFSPPLVRALVSNTEAMHIIKKYYSNIKFLCNSLVWSELSKNKSIFEPINLVPILCEII